MSYVQLVHAHVRSITTDSSWGFLVGDLLYVGIGT
jgi:hypothetical protein